MNQFNKDYYENGIELGISGYSNFHWMPDMTIPMCHHLVNHLKINNESKILDFGCAKGYIVKALNLLGYDSYGVDVSEYAIASADKSIQDKVKVISCPSDLKHAFDTKFTHITAKDVFEHIQEDAISLWINNLRDLMHDNAKLYLLVPLADNGQYRIPFYETDVTHVIRRDEQWWDLTIRKCGFKQIMFAHKLQGIKDNWSMWENGNLQAIYQKC